MHNDGEELIKELSDIFKKNGGKEIGLLEALARLHDYGYEEVESYKSLISRRVLWTYNDTLEVVKNNDIFFMPNLHYDDTYSKNDYLSEVYFGILIGIIKTKTEGGI